MFLTQLLVAGFRVRKPTLHVCLLGFDGGKKGFLRVASHHFAFRVGFPTQISCRLKISIKRVLSGCDVSC